MPKGNFPAGEHEYGRMAIECAGERLGAFDAQIDPAVLSRAMGHNQITDAYLLALAVHHSGALATFDHRVALSAIGGATGKNLKLL